MSFKSWKKKMKKTFAFKAAKATGRGAAKVVKYVAPPVGAVFLGPLGAAVGTGMAAVASQVGPNKNRTAALKRSLVYGGSITAGTAALGVLSGSGLGASVLTSLGKMFGPTAPVAPVTDQQAAMDNAFLSPMTPTGPQGSPALAQAISILGTRNGIPDSAGTGGIIPDPSVADPRQGGAGLFEQIETFAGPMMGGEAPGFFQTPEGETDWVKLGLVAGAAWFLLFRKRAA